MGTDPISRQGGVDDARANSVATVCRGCGNNRSPCFVAGWDYRIYLRYLRHYAGQFGCAVHAYCLMTNHVHLLLTPFSASSCAKLMKHLGQCYVQTFNMAHRRSGTLWEGRFHSCLVPSEEYVLARWSSFQLNSRALEDGLVTRNAARMQPGVAGSSGCLPSVAAGLPRSANVGNLAIVPALH